MTHLRGTRTQSMAGLPVGDAAASAYLRRAELMRTQYAAEFPWDAFSRAFLAAENVAPILFYVEQAIKAKRRSLQPDVQWNVVYGWLREFASMDTRVPGSAWRQFASLRDANRAFKNSMVDPALVADQYVFHWQWELAQKHMNGIDASQLRRYARNPGLVDDRGRPRLLGRANKGVGTLQLRTGPYFLGHPDANGRAKQRAALALSNFGPDPDVRCAFTFRPRLPCTADSLCGAPRAGN